MNFLRKTNYTNYGFGWQYKDLEFYKVGQGKKGRRTLRFDEANERLCRAGNDSFLSEESA